MKGTEIMKEKFGILPDGTQASLYTITGGGYPYPHGFRDNTFVAADFDGLWGKYLHR